MKMLQTARQRLEYLAILLPYRLIRLLPYRMIRLLGRLFGAGMHLVPIRATSSGASSGMAA